MRTVPFAGCGAAVLLLAGCGSAPAPRPTAPGSTAAVSTAAVSTAQSASIVMAPASGSLVSGKLTARPTPDGVRITGEVGGLPPSGMQAIHIHETGDCSAADATSAGGHFNPGQQPHGKSDGIAHHAGDMNNILAHSNGVAQVDVQARGVTLGGGAANDIAGRAVVIHAKADDYQSQPAGNAGARVACGIITVVQ